MSSDSKIPFHFHALGHALSGTFHRPFAHVIDAQASTSLPSIGGHASARIENFRAHHFASFRAGHSHVSGSWMGDEAVVTKATATLEDLNILDFITADRVTARLTSEGKKGQKESHIIALGSAFDNLRIAGHPVKVTLRHSLFLDCPTFADLRKAVASDAKSGKMLGLGDDAALCSLVEKIETDLPGVQITGHLIRIPHFGVISLAEVFAVPGTRTLTMIRLKLGSPDGGQATGAEVLSQGQPMPPVG
ncbi:MAG TPA: choice-of-anchor P family protein [Candidatus Acidoferrum sp.]|nr:choice-of-anchor P family protein [Candidatus Acidoferrum sp.]